MQLNGKQLNLGPNKDEAFKQHHELMAKRGETRSVVVTDAGADAILVVLLDNFIVWCFGNRAPKTCDSYKDYLQSFINSLENMYLLATDLRPYHLQQWVDSQAGWCLTTKRNGIKTVQRALNWAVKQGFLDKSPVANMEKPPAAKREQVIDCATYQRMRDLTHRQEFLDLIDVCWETGCRPQEIWHVEKQHFDQARKRWVFPALESKGRKKIRVVYLTDLATEICQRLSLKWPTGKLFRSSNGKRWTKSGVSKRFGRMAAALGTHYALVDFRHSFTTRALKNGVDPVTLAFLLGHADTSMLARQYAHLDQEIGHLRGALDKVNRAAV